MFFRKRKRYNGDVSALLPAFGISMDEAGVFKLLNVLDLAWEQGYNIYEAALLVAYSFAGGLYENGLLERADTFVRDKLMPVQNDWLTKSIVRSDLIALWPEKLRRRAEAAHPVPTTELTLSPSMPDVTQRPAIATYSIERFGLLLVNDAKTLAERLSGASMPIEYPFVLAVLDLHTQIPCMFVTLERGLTASTFLCAFQPDGSHVNLGDGTSLASAEQFAQVAIGHVCDTLNLDSNKVQKLP